MTAPTRKFLIASSALVAAGLCTGMIAYYGGLPMGAFSADRPDELSYVPANAAVVGFADVREVMSSQLRQKLRTVMPPEDKGREEFKAQTGIDIENDIEHVVACMIPGADTAKSGFVVLRGRFDTVKLEALAREHNAVVEDYNGVRMVRMSPKETSDAEHQGRHRGSPALAFAETGVIIVGEESALKQAIDTHRSGRSVLDNSEVMAHISSIEGGANAWAVGRLDVLASQAKLPEQVAAQVPSVSWFAVAGHVNGGMNGTVRAEARDEEAARNLRDVINGFLALARMQAGSKPQFQALAQSVTLSTSGKTVQLDFTVPVELFDAISQLKGQVKDGAAH